MADKDDLGRAGEERAVEHLRTIGWLVLDRNWRCRQGEIDVVARDGDVLVVVEVKTRSGLGFGHPFEAVTRAKLARLRRLTSAWVAEHPDEARDRRIRIDAIALTGSDPRTAELEHLKGVS